MDLDGTHTEPKAIGDFPTRQPVSDESKDLPLSWGELGVPLTPWLFLCGRACSLVGRFHNVALLAGRYSKRLVGMEERRDHFVFRYSSKTIPTSNSYR